MSVSAELRKLIDQTDADIGRLLPLMKPFASSSVLNEEQSFVFAQLSNSCLSATAPTLLLVEDERGWDAEITLRSVVEGSVKWQYLLASKELFSSRFEEFSVALTDIGSLRSHERAKELIAAFSDKGHEDLDFFRAITLSPEKEVELRTKYDRKKRQAIEQRWSFTEMVTELSKSTKPEAKLMRSLLYGYWSANQLAHMSYEGVMLPAERRGLSQVRQDAAAEAHMVRIVSDCYSHAFLRVLAALRFADADTDELHQQALKRSINVESAAQVLKTWRELELPLNDLS